MGEGGPHRFIVPFFDDATGGTATGSAGAVRLNRSYLVPSRALDFCVLSSDGSAHLAADAPAPPHLIPSWRQRHRELAKWVGNVVNQYEGMAAHDLGSNGATFLTAGLTLATSPTRLTSLISRQMRSVTFGLRRVGRLRDPYRTAVMTRAAQRDMRDAFDAELLDE